ncbi:MAG: hypothetical protein J6V03_02605 [Clostridia bacterium]|nr:hypothetical protein [Clostridia bacterium]
MIKVDATVKNETRYIAYFCLILSVLMQSVFIFLHKWTYAVLLGNLLSIAVAILNFFVMGITVQKAVTLEVNDAKKLMRSSQNLRKAGMFVAVVIGVVAPFFNTIAVIVPLFFPRIAVSFRPLIKDKKEVIDK